MDPIEELIEKLRDLNSRGWINSEGSGSGRYGLALERELSIPRNSDKKPDFKGIELKTKASAKLQTLFSRTPSRHTGCSNNLDLIQSWGYRDKKTGRQQLYTSINCEGFRWRGPRDDGDGPQHAAVRKPRDDDDGPQYNAVRKPHDDDDGMALTNKLFVQFTYEN